MSTKGQDLTSGPTATPSSSLLEIRLINGANGIPTATKVGMAVGFSLAGLLIILLLYLYLRERRLRKRLEWRMTKAPGRITKSSSKVPHKTAPAVSRPLKPTAKGGGGGGGRTEKVRNIKPSTQLPPKVRLESAGWRPTIHQGIPRQPSRPTAAELEP